MTKTKKNAHLWERDPDDWYVEPIECSLALFAEEKFDGPIWDPACGLCNIVSAARTSGQIATGTDIKIRSDLCAMKHDFLEEKPPFVVKNIVSNPPFREAEAFVNRSLNLVGKNGKVAMLLPMVWLSGFSTKRDWLPDSPLLRYYAISPRPSMPPGKVIEAGIKPGNGTKDFAWFVWQKDFKGKAEVGFLNTKSFKLSGREHGTSETIRHQTQ